MQDAWRTYLGMALGLTEAPRRKAQQVAGEFINRGGSTAAQLHGLVEDLLSAGVANREAVTSIVRYEVDRALGVVGLATAEEVTELTGRVHDLERQLREAQVRVVVAESAASVAPARGGSAPTDDAVAESAAPQADKRPLAPLRKAAKKVAAKRAQGGTPNAMPAAATDVATGRKAPSTAAAVDPGTTGRGPKPATAANNAATATPPTTPDPTAPDPTAPDPTAPDPVESDPIAPEPVAVAAEVLAAPEPAAAESLATGPVAPEPVGTELEPDTEVADPAAGAAIAESESEPEISSAVVDPASIAEVATPVAESVPEASAEVAEPEAAGAAVETAPRTAAPRSTAAAKKVAPEKGVAKKTVAKKAVAKKAVAKKAAPKKATGRRGAGPTTPGTRS